LPKTNTPAYLTVMTTTVRFDAIFTWQKKPTKPLEVFADVEAEVRNEDLVGNLFGIPEKSPPRQSA
jgi:hypothetical protein